jgi:hemolysin III
MSSGFFARFKDPVSGLTHLASAIVAAVGSVFLVISGSSDPLRAAVLAVYGVSLVLLFSASALYHLARTTPPRELIFRRIDHSAIFVLIAGTYTPICVIALPGTPGALVLVTVWVLAVAGILSKIFFFGKIPDWVSTVLYVLMGWFAVIVAVPLVRNLPLPGLLWLLAGGGFYTVGTVFYSMKKLVVVPGVFGNHEIWHLFVSAGAAAHFVLILRFVSRL